MKHLHNTTIRCPHCGHTTHVQLDTSNGDQDFVEDCANCCNPIHLNVHVDERFRKIELSVDADDEQIF